MATAPPKTLSMASIDMPCFWHFVLLPRSQSNRSNSIAADDMHLYRHFQARRGMDNLPHHRLPAAVMRDHLAGHVMRGVAREIDREADEIVGHAAMAHRNAAH